MPLTLPFEAQDRHESMAVALSVASKMPTNRPKLFLDKMRGQVTSMPVQSIASTAIFQHMNANFHRKNTPKKQIPGDRFLTCDA